MFVTALDVALVDIADTFPTLKKRAERLLLDAFGARSLGELREQIGTDYADHVLELRDYGLRAFVDRALNPDTSQEAWLDGTASLVTGRRPESWDDDTVDTFGYEIRAFAQRLARRLALIRESRAQKSPITAIHVTSSDGTEWSLYVRTSGNGLATSPSATALRELLSKSGAT